MTRTCPSCGTAAASEARFCRRCGTPLPRVTSARPPDDEFVSPQAATIPLSEEGRTTNGLAPDELGRPNADTTRVNRSELDELLRTVRQERTLDAPAAPQTPEENHQPRHTTRAADFHIPPEAYSNSVTQPSLRALPQHSDGETRAVSNGELASAEEFDDEVTITVTRTPPMPTPAPRQVVPLNGVETQSAGVLPPRPEAEDEELVAAELVEASSRPAPARRGRSQRFWYIAAGLSLGLLLLTGLAAWLGVGYFRQPAPAAADSNVVAPSTDARQRAEEKMTEAEALLAAGDLEGAVARLREATTLDPASTRARRRLGDLLLNQGRRREAIEEYRAIVRRDPRDAESWRALAHAQLDESLFADAAESFRQLVVLGGQENLNDNERLSYAEALRLSGRAREAQNFYQRLITSEMVDVSNTARQRLAELAAATTASPTPDAGGEAARNAHEQTEPSRGAQNAPTPPVVSTTPAAALNPPNAPQTQSPTPAPQSSHTLSAGDHFKRGEQLWWSQRGAALEEFRAAAGKGNRDAFYYLGLGIAEGKDPRTLNRALLGAAFQYFQNAARGGKFRNEARRYEQQLGEELDRRRASGQ